MEDFIKDKFKKENLMVRARLIEETGISMKESGKKVTKMEWERILGKIKS